MKERLYEVSVTYTTPDGRREQIFKTVRAISTYNARSEAKEQVDRWGRTNVKTGVVRDLGEVD